MTDRVARGGLALCALVAVGLVLTFAWIIVSESVAFFRRVPLLEFLTGTVWTPLFESQEFGVLPLLATTVQITVGAALIAVPLGLLTAIYLQEFAPKRSARILNGGVELLAGVPTVVYGYFALTFVTPQLRWFFPTTEVFNWGSASLVVGLMILPTVASLSREALAAVPPNLRDSALGLGATRSQAVLRVVAPAARSGIAGSVVLAMARAIGETMTVSMAAGNHARLALNPLEGAQTLTAYIAQVSLGDTPSGTLEYQTLFAVGSLLFIVTYVMTFLGRRALLGGEGRHRIA